MSQSQFFIIIMQSRKKFQTVICYLKIKRGALQNLILTAKDFQFYRNTAARTFSAVVNKFEINYKPFERIKTLIQDGD